MNAQNLTTSMMTCGFVVSPEADFPLASSIYASSRDYGFDFDEEELARELVAPLPITPAAQPIPEVDADEFEKTFQTFSS